MPPRSGQLDQISEAIGELRGMVQSLDRYTHEREHGLNNLSQKVDALGSRIAKDMAGVEGRLEAKLDAWKREVDARLVKLETQAREETGAKNLARTLLQSPLLAWIFAICVLAYEALKGQRP
jgi:hypothetical protein